MWFSYIFVMPLCCLKQAGKLIQIQQQKIVVVVSLLINQDFSTKTGKQEKHSLEGGEKGFSQLQTFQSERRRQRYEKEREKKTECSLSLALSVAVEMKPFFSLFSAAISLRFFLWRKHW